VSEHAASSGDALSALQCPPGTVCLKPDLSQVQSPLEDLLKLLSPFLLPRTFTFEEMKERSHPINILLMSDFHWCSK
jgi:hypothetical protein